MFHTLLADGSPFFRHVLRNILSRHFPFMLVCEAANGRRALMLESEYHPQLIFVDVKLPDRSGLEVARQLKAVNPAAAVCVLTQHDIPEYRMAAQQCGADHFIAKDESSESTIVALVEATIASRFRVLLINHNEGLRRRVGNLLLHRWPAMVIIEASTALAACAAWLQPHAVVLSQAMGANGRNNSPNTIRDRHPDADLVIITQSERIQPGFSSPPLSAVQIPQNENFGERLVAAIGSIVDAHTSSV